MGYYPKPRGAHKVFDDVKLTVKNRDITSLSQSEKARLKASDITMMFGRKVVLKTDDSTGTEVKFLDNGQIVYYGIVTTYDGANMPYQPANQPSLLRLLVEVNFHPTDDVGGGPWAAIWECEERR